MAANEHDGVEGSEGPWLRIDDAHPLASSANVEAASTPAVPSPLAVVAMDAAEPISVQVTQLARHLQERRREVDHREALLNARIAQLENDLRVSRMWLRERSEEFGRREAELMKKVEEQEARIRGLSSSEIAWDDARLKQSQQLQAREEELQRREERNEQDRTQLAEQQHTCQVRHQQLDEQERSLDEQWRQLHRERVELQRQMNETLEQLDGEKQACARRRQAIEEYDRHQRQAWEARQQQFEERQIALERIRDDILRLHRESLEMRLVAEQLWSELKNQTAPGELAEAAARLRAQLADEYRFAQQEITRQHRLLEELVCTLDARRQELARQRDELLAWVARRQQELGKQSAELQEREEAGRRERQKFQHDEQQWHTERANLQRQIRRLAGQLRAYERAAA